MSTPRRVSQAAGAAGLDESAVVLERTGYSALNGEGISEKCPCMRADGAIPTI
jgi:hypothetical protein